MSAGCVEFEIASSLLSSDPLCAFPGGRRPVTKMRDR
jgi:hypothetical protein